MTYDRLCAVAVSPHFDEPMDEVGTRHFGGCIFSVCFGVASWRSRCFFLPSPVTIYDTHLCMSLILYLRPHLSLLLLLRLFVHVCVC